MLGLYLFCLGIGGTLILASLLLGSGDKDLSDHDGHFSADGQADADHDGQVDADGQVEVDGQADTDGHADHGHAPETGKGEGFESSWLLSMRFWTFATATFGMTGTLLTLLSVPTLLTALLAVVIGGGLGFGAARLFSALNKDEVSGSTELSRFVGEEANVMLPIREGQRGKIAIQSPAGRVEMLAVSRDEGTLDVGSNVLVVSVVGGVADVSRMPELPKGGQTHHQRASGQRSRAIERGS